jgi:predicted RNase H-like HicB family nuclease
MSMNQRIHVDFVTHAPTGLVIAISNDLKGLYVHGHSIEEVRAGVPDAIRELLEFAGLRVEKIEEVDGLPEGFEPLFAKFEAEYRDAA